MKKSAPAAPAAPDSLTHPLNQEKLKIEVAPIGNSLKYQSFMGTLTPTDATLRERGGGRGYALYDELKRDPVVFANLQKRSMALVGKPFSLRPLDEAAIALRGNADVGMLLAQKAVDTIGFDTLCHQLLDATLKGFAVSELMWRPDVWVEGFGYAWLPVAAIGRDQNRFQFAVKPDSAGEYELRVADGLQGLSNVAVPTGKCIVHRYNSHSGDPYGHGIGSELYWPVFFTREVQAFWAEHLEKFGQPIPTASYPDIGFDDTEQRKLLSAISNIRRAGGITFPEGVKLNLIAAANAGAASYEQFMRYQDESKIAIITGESLGSGSGGAQAAAAADRRDVRGDIVKADGDLLSATLNNTLFKWIADINGVPRCLVDRNLEQAEDIERRSKVDQVLFSMGWQPSAERVAQVYGQGYEPTAPVATAPAALFAEAAQASDKAGFDAVDAAVAALPADALKHTQEDLVGQALDLVTGAASFAEAEAALVKILGGSTSALEAQLAKAMFAAQTFGRAQP